MLPIRSTAAGMLMLVVCTVLPGCSKDPVAKDLQTFGAVIKQAINPQELAPLEQKVRTARSPQEQATLMEDPVEAVERQVIVLGSFHPKTPRSPSFRGICATA